jgi:hypothetical protein
MGRFGFPSLKNKRREGNWIQTKGRNLPKQTNSINKKAPNNPLKISVLEFF